MKTLLWNTLVSLSSAALGLAVTCGFCAIGCPAFLAATVGTVAYVSALLANVK